MKTISLKKVVPFSLKHIVSIVGDVDNYAAFLPWLAASKTHSRKENTFIGVLTIAYKGIRYSYDSKVVITEADDHAHIKALALNGPFESMMTHWHIAKIDEATSSITLSIKMTWKNPIFKMMFESMMDDASIQMIDAFEKRLTTQL
ncbi:MAG: hypothetical protein CNLJKLNK_00318 [Holosporales bacterium]